MNNYDFDKEDMSRNQRPHKIQYLKIKNEQKDGKRL